MPVHDINQKLKRKTDLALIGQYERTADKLVSYARQLEEIKLDQLIHIDVGRLSEQIQIFKDEAERQRGMAGILKREVE